MKKNHIFCPHLEIYWRKDQEQDPDPESSGTNQQLRIL